MKISSLEEDIVTVPYEHNGDVLNLQINRNIVTPAYLREIGTQSRTFETNGNGTRKKKKSKAASNGHDNDFDKAAKMIEEQVKVYVPLLSNGLLKGWDLTEDDGTTLVSVVDGLRRLADKAPLLIVDLWSFAMETAQSEKKMTTTLPAIGDGLLETQPPEETDALST